MSTMLYKTGKTAKLHGIDCDYQVFSDDDLENAIKDGWCKSPKQAKEAEEAALKEDIAKAEAEKAETEKKIQEAEAKKLAEEAEKAKALQVAEEKAKADKLKAEKAKVAAAKNNTNKQGQA